MVASSGSSRLQDLAHQVWYLPHVRKAVFDELARDPPPGECYFTFLSRFLTLDKITSLDVAPMLVETTALDEFPWDCPDERRKKAYAAGVRTLAVTGSIPMCVQWDSFTDMLSFFPNVDEVIFASTMVRFERNMRGQHRNTFSIWQSVCVADDGTVSKPTIFVPIEDFDYNVVRNLECGPKLSESARPFTTLDDGQLEIPEVLLQPVRHFDVSPPPDKHEDWLTILEHRTALGVPTPSITWNMDVREAGLVLPRLPQVVPRDLRLLRLMVSSNGPHSVILDFLMGIIDKHRFPKLQRLILHLSYFQGSKTDGVVELERSSSPPPWIEHELPFGLGIVVELVIRNLPTAPHSDRDAYAQSMLESLPLFWIEDARRALGEAQGRLRINTFLSIDEGMVVPFEPPAVLAALTPNTEEP